MPQIIHMGVDIQGMLNSKRKHTYCTDDNGNPMTDKQVRQELRELLAKGHKVMPMNPDCDCFDPITGCPGHDKGEWEEKMRLKKITELKAELHKLEESE